MAEVQKLKEIPPNIYSRPYLALHYVIEQVLHEIVHGFAEIQKNILKKALIESGAKLAAFANKKDAYFESPFLQVDPSTLCFDLFRGTIN